jgi:hypothetical protein
MLVVGSLSFFTAGAPIRARIAASQGLTFQPEVNMNHDEMTTQLSAMVLGAFRNA